MKSVLFSKKTPANTEVPALKAALLQAEAELTLAYQRFNLAVDPELIDACIYEINSIKSRCNYLIRRIKSCHPDALAAAHMTKEDSLWT